MKPEVVRYIFNSAGDIVAVQLRTPTSLWFMPMAEWCARWRA